MILATKRFVEGHKAGLEYCVEIAVAATMKNIPTASDHNPKVTPKDKLKCPYCHPFYCTKLGHSSCNSNDCAMKMKSKDERAAALKDIRDSRVVIKMKKNEELVGRNQIETIV